VLRRTSVVSKTKTAKGRLGMTVLASTTISLSPREAEVCLFLVGGLQLKEIALQLNISIHTACCHRKNIYSKLRLHSRNELIERFRGSEKREEGNGTARTRRAARVRRGLNQTRKRPDAMPGYRRGRHRRWFIVSASTQQAHRQFSRALGPDLFR
jgi:DNA-binding CsgD family transcriptional regulator